MVRARPVAILSGSGSGAWLGRAIAQDLETVDRQGAARKLIEQADLKGKGDYSFPNPRELSDDLRHHRDISDQSRRRSRRALERLRLLPLTDPRPSLQSCTEYRCRDRRPFRCRSLEYRETSVAYDSRGNQFREKPAPVEYQKALSGKTPYGSVNGRIEVRAAAVIEGRTVRTTARVADMFDSPVCPTEFAAMIRGGMDIFGGFRHGRLSSRRNRAPSSGKSAQGSTKGVNAYTREQLQSRDGTAHAICRERGRECAGLSGQDV